MIDPAERTLMYELEAAVKKYRKNSLAFSPCPSCGPWLLDDIEKACKAWRKCYDDPDTDVS